MRRFQLPILLVLAIVSASCSKNEKAPTAAAPTPAVESPAASPSAATPAATQVASEWPQFRGPSGQGTSSETGLPEKWGKDGQGVRWMSPAPWGNSSPVVGAGRVFLTAAFREPKKNRAPRGVMAFDLESGKLLWEKRLYSAELEKRHALNTNAAPTPLWDGSRLYVYFGPVLAAVDADGNELWQQEIDPDYEKYSRYGAASSLVATENAIIVTQDREYGQKETKDVGWMAAYNKADGKRLWRTQWDNSCCSYSTPVIAGSGADAEILFAHSNFFAAYDAQSGEQLWKYPYEINQMVASPSVDGDLIAVAGGAHNVKSSHFLRRKGRGKETQIEVIASFPRFAPQTSSPVLYKGLYFTVTDQGVVACYRGETGELLYKEKVPHGGNRASLVAGDGKVYVFSGSGQASVVAAEPTFRLIATNDLGEALAEATPAIADGCLLVRGDANLYCIGAKG